MSGTLSRKDRRKATKRTQGARSIGHGSETRFRKRWNDEVKLILEDTNIRWKSIVNLTINRKQWREPGKAPLNLTFRHREVGVQDLVSKMLQLNKNIDMVRTRSCLAHIFCFNSIMKNYYEKSNKIT